MTHKIVFVKPMEDIETEKLRRLRPKELCGCILML